MLSDLIRRSYLSPNCLMLLHITLPTNYACNFLFKGFYPLNDEDYVEDDIVSGYSSAPLPKQCDVSPGIKLIHINCRSVYEKMTDIEMFVQLLLPDVLFLSETWLRDSVFSLLGYSSHHYIRPTRGGGVSICVKEGVTFDPVKCDIVPTSFEFIVLRVTLGVPTTICMYVCISPSTLLICLLISLLRN